MGVDRTDYMMVGIKLPGKLKSNETGKNIDYYEDETFVKYLEGWEEVKDFRIIDDGMSGQYTVFGKIIVEADDDADGFDFVEIDPMNSQAIAKQVSKEFIKVFKDHLSPAILKKINKPKLFIFSHFS